MRGWSSISSTASMRWLRNGKLNSARPRGLARDPHERLGDRLAGAFARARRASRRDRPSSRRGPSVSTYTPFQSSGGRFASASRTSSARRWSSSSAASRCGEVERLQRLPRRRAVEERAVLHAEQQADAACRRLRPELAAGVGFLVDEVEDDLEELGARVALREPERDRAAGAAVDLGHPVDLGRGAFVVLAGPLEARRDLVHALAVPAEHVGDREQLVVRRPTCRARGGRRGRGAAACATSRSRARPRPSPRRRGRSSRRCRRRSRASSSRPRSPIDVVAERAVADHAADVDALRQRVDRARGTRRRSPSPNARPSRMLRGGDVLDRLHEPGEPVGLPGAHRCERHAAVAEHDRGDAVPARRRRVGVPRELRVEVRVHVDEAGRDVRAVGVDARAGRRPRRSPTATMRSPSIATSAANGRVARCRRRPCRP